MTEEPLVTRRTVLSKAAAISLTAPLLAGCGSVGQSDPGGNPTPANNDDDSGEENDANSNPQPDDPSFDGWMDNVDNYDTVVDETSSDNIRIIVGAEGNNGNFAFDPAAVRISPGTSITWEWNGLGGQHDVVETDGAFESELAGDEGHEFTHAFDDSGTYKYSCTPHETIGMKGVVVVE